MRNEFAAEGFGEDGLREFLDVRFGFRVARFDLVGQRKQCFHSAHDFLLFGERRKGDYYLANSILSDIEHRIFIMAFPKKKKKARFPVEGPLRRLPGQSIREERERLFDDKVMGYFFAVLGTWLVAGWQWLYEETGALPSPRFATLVAVIITVYCAYRIWRIYPEFRNLNLGEKGERRVSEVLRTLRHRDYVTFDDLLLEGVNVDHVVVGAGGVFAVETKTFSIFGNGSAGIDASGVLQLGGNPVFKGSAKTGSRIRRHGFSRIKAMDAPRHLGESGCCSTGVAN